MRYQIRSLNETVTLDRLDERNRLFRLHYENPFYGSCTLRVRLLRLTDGRPWIDPESMQVESCAVRKGDPNSLLSVAQRCLVHLVAQQPEILSGGGHPVAGGFVGRILRLLGSATQLRPAPGTDTETETHNARIT